MKRNHAHDSDKGPVSALPRTVDVETLTSEQLGERKVARWQFSGPYAFLGKLVAVFYLVVYGPPGAGKSTWVMGLARALADLAPVLYVSAEEKHAPTFSDRIRRMGAAHKHLHVRPYVSTADILQAVRALKARFVILDSATVVDVSSKLVHELWQTLEAEGVALVAVGHVTTDGHMKGGTYLAHDTHAVVRIEGGVARAEKNRYAEGGETESPVAFSAADVKKAGGYGFTVFDKEDRVWAKNPGNWSDNPAARAAMFIRLRESGEYDEGLANRSRSRSNRGASAAGGASAPAPFRDDKRAGTGPKTPDGPEKAKKKAIPAPSSTTAPQTSFTDAQARRILAIEAAGEVRDGKNRYAVVERRTDARGKSLFVVRAADGDLGYVYVDGKGALLRQPGRDEAAVARLAPAGPLPADPGPAPAPEPPAPKGRAARPAAAPKPAAKKPAAATTAPKPSRALSDAEKSLARIEKTLTAALAKK